MDFKISLENEFIPEWRENRKLSENEQIKIKWTWPTAMDMESCVDVVIDEDGSKVKINYLKLVERCTKEIINLSVNGKIVKTGTQLINQPGLSDLAVEWKNYLRTVDELDEKNS